MSEERSNGMCLVSTDAAHASAVWNAGREPDAARLPESRNSDEAGLAAWLAHYEELATDLLSARGTKAR